MSKTKTGFLATVLIRLLVLLVVLAASITTALLARSMLISPWVAVAVMALSLVVAVIVLVWSIPDASQLGRDDPALREKI